MLIKKLKNLSERDKNLIVNSIGALFTKGLGLVLSLFTMPAYMRFFNDDVTLGLWFTILSVLSWMTYFDFGIGNGLRNRLAESWALGETEKSKKYVSSAYFSIGTVCLVVAAVFVSIAHLIDWNTVFNVTLTSVSKQALCKCVCIVFVGIAFQLFLRLINSILYALQKSAINNWLGLIVSIIQVSALYILPSSTNDKNIVVMAIVNIGATLLPMIVATIVLFAMKKYRVLAPSFKYFKFKYAKDVLSIGGIFLFAQILYMVIMNTNEYLIGIFVGNEMVVEYQIYYKLFSLISTLFLLVLTPLWSAITKALAEGNVTWIKKIYNKMLIFAIFAVGAGFVLIPMMQFIVNIWLGAEAIQTNYLYSLAFAVLATGMVLNCVFSSFSNGIGKLRTQVICFGVGAILKIPASWLLIKVFGSWIGVVWANAITLLIYCIIQPIVFSKGLFAKSNLIQKGAKDRNTGVENTANNE